VQRALPINIRTREAPRLPLLPKTSANWPHGRMKAAEVRLKAAAIQLNCELSPKYLAIHGKALAILCFGQPSIMEGVCSFAYMVESKACKAKGRMRPRISFHRYLVAARFSARQVKQGADDGAFRWMQVLGDCFLGAKERRKKVIIMIWGG
jgi:hypothetical protein